MINIFLIERQKIVREGLKVLLDEEENFKVFISENKDVKISQINCLKPDLIVVSLDNMDEADFDYLNIFLDINQNLYQLEYFNPVKIIVYAGRVNEFILNKALEIGCQGYLLKESSIEELKQAIRSVYNGYKHIGNSVFSQIQQLSIADRAIAVAEKNFNTVEESYHTGLLTTGIIDSEKLDFEIEIGNSKTDKRTLQNVTQSKDTSSYAKSLPGTRAKKWFQDLSSTIFLISLGCLAGVVGVFYLSDRTNESLQPITKHGIVRGDTVSIKSPVSGKIKQHRYQVGNLVEANEIVAEIEPLVNKQQQQNINEVTTKITETARKLNEEKQLLAELKSQVSQEQEKIQQLIVNSKDRSNNQLLQNKPKEQLPASLEKLQIEVKAALADYQRLQKLKQQKIVSLPELERGKQIWKSLESELIENQNRLRQNSADFSTVDRQADNKLLEQLRKNLSQLQIKVSKGENAVEMLEKKLSKFQTYLNNIDSDRQQQLISIKAPVKGIIHQLNTDRDQQIGEDKAIVELINCQNLWIEVMISGNDLKKIDFQPLVTLHLEGYQHNLRGQVASIESLSKLGKTKQNPYYNTFVSSIHLEENTIEREMFFNIKINFSSLENYVQHHKSCGVGEPGLVTFNS